MQNRPLIAASAAAVATMALVAVIALSRLPSGAMLPIHWNAAGEADRFADARFALAMPIVVTAALASLLAVVPRIEPLQDRLSDSMPLLRACWTGLLVLMLLVQAVVAGPAFGIEPGGNAVLAGTGVLLMTIGNALPKSRPGFFVGIRTPWALIDTDNWIATHRLGSRTIMGGGAVMLAAAIVPLDPAVRAATVLAATAVAVLPPVAYSYLLWRRGRAA